MNKPISPCAYKLQHRKSIHDYFNPELGHSNSKTSSNLDELKANGMVSSPAKATATGLVSEAFRKQNKFT